MIRIGLSFDDILLIPNYSEVISRIHIDLSTKVTKNFKIKLPILSANMDTITEFDMADKLYEFGGLGIIHRFCTISKEVEIIRKLRKAGNEICAGSIGVAREYKERLQALVDAGANIICIDVAHGHHKLMADTINLCKKYNVDIIAGNIATAEAAEFLCKDGVDAV